MKLYNLEAAFQEGIEEALEEVIHRMVMHCSGIATKSCAITMKRRMRCK